MAAATLLLLAACFSPAFQEDEAFGRLAAGRYIVQNHRLPVPDPFAFTTYIGSREDLRVKLAGAWLADTLMYLAWAAGGFALVVWVRVLLMGAACALVGRIAWRRRASFEMSVGAVLLAASISYRFVGDSPTLATFVLLAAAMALAESRRWLWVLPLLFVVWANCNGAFFLGWAALAVYALLGRKDWRLWIAAVVSILACGLNPNGFRVLDWRVDSWWWPAAAVVVPVAIAAIVPWRPGELRARWAFVAAALIAATIAVPVRQKRAFQFSAWQATRPIAAANFFLSHHLPGPLFNTIEQGGYLEWYLGPRTKVFIDGRDLNPAILHDYRRIVYSNTEKSPFQLLDQYGVQTLLLTAFDYSSGSPHYLLAMLADPAQTQWKAIYQDGLAAIFVRQAPPGVRVLPNVAALTSMEAQCAAHIRLVPNEPLCARETAKMFEYLGNAARARVWLAYYLEHKKRPDPGAETEYQRLSPPSPLRKQGQ